MAENVLLKKGGGSIVGILVWKINPKSKLDKYFGCFLVFQNFILNISREIISLSQRNY